MSTTLNCIALRTVRFNESKNLLTVWTRQSGRLTLAMPAGASREARRRRALTTPLSTFDCVADIKPGREVHSVRDMSAAPHSLAVEFSAPKQLVSMFLAEVLDLLLKRAEPDGPLSDFLFYSLEVFAALTEPAAVANFHIVFLYGLSYFAGIAPDLSGWSNGAVFDLREGVFRTTLPMHRDFLSSRESLALVSVSRVSYRTAGRLPFNREARNRALDVILQYYTFHLASMSSVKSLEILRAMLD